MSKGVVSLGYGRFVVDTQDALTILEILAKAEMFEEKYHGLAEGGSTFHVWQQDQANGGQYGFRLLPDSLYRMGKLAGKPEERK